MADTACPRSRRPATDQPSWKRCLNPGTLPGAILAAVIGGLIVLAITYAAALL
jgi:hypothetical protein